MTLQEKVKLIDMYHRLKSAAVVACHLRINESSVMTIVKNGKEIYDTIPAAMPGGAKILHFLPSTFLSHIAHAAFVRV